MPHRFSANGQQREALISWVAIRRFNKGKAANATDYRMRFLVYLRAVKSHNTVATIAIQTSVWLILGKESRIASWAMRVDRYTTEQTTTTTTDLSRPAP